MGSMGVMGDKIAKPAKPAKLAKKATPRVAVCFDSFKGCVGAEEASRQVAAALCEAGYEAWALPMADGGEGTARVLTLAGVRQPAVDMALKAGLGNREGTSRARVMKASTFELGRMLARMSGSEGEILLGVGGSATCDGGMGLLAALGARLRFRGAEVSRPAAKDLANLQEIDLSGVKAPRVRMLVDVRAPLTGAEGAALRFSPQKGATPQQAEWLDGALRHYASVAARCIGCSAEELMAMPGGGAGGGIVVAGRLLGWQREWGAEYVIRQWLPQLQQADVIITGEGRTDESSAAGKVPFALLEAARRLGKPVILLSGCVRVPQGSGLLDGFAAVRGVSPLNESREDMTAAATVPRLKAAALHELLGLFGC